MRKFASFSLLPFLFFFLVGCAQNVEAPSEPTATEAAATPTAAATATAIPATPTAAATATVAPATATVAPTATEAPPTEPAPSPTATSAEPTAPPPVEIEEDEAILILTPGNTSRVLSPVRVAGEADSTFEQNLVVRIVDIDGEELAFAPTTIAADLGQRGPFEIELSFNVQEEQQAWIQVFSTSARDGGVTHLSSTAVTLATSGEANIVAATPHPERIVIDQPAPGDTVSGGSVQVTGRGLASFEQTLIIELLNEEGTVIEMQPLNVLAPDLGQPGTFTAQFAYSVGESTPARIVVRDPSPAFGGDVHLASVEVFLEP